MLKWFNTNGKKLMVGVMVILMIAFLVPQGVTMFQPDPRELPVGTIGGQIVLTRNDVNRSDFTVNFLKRMGLAPFGADNEDEGLRWALAQHEAQQILGIDAGSAEVNGVLAQLFADEDWGQNKSNDQRLAMERFNQPASAMRTIVREFLIFQKYSQLLFGVPAAPPQYTQMQQMFLAQRRAVSVERLSAPALEELVVSNSTPATGRVLTIDADRYLDRVAEPTEARLLEVFNKYKDSLPESGGRFGYRYPTRVKLQTLTFPLQAALAQVPDPKATEITAYFEENQDQFEGKTEYEARGQIIQTLKARAAIQRASEAADRARDIMTRALNADDLAENPDGSLVIPAGYEPLALADVAKQIEEAFGFAPTVSAPGLAREWTALQAMANDPQLATIVYAPSQQQVYPLPFYLASARELQASDTPHPLSSLGLQVGVPSQRLVKFNFVRQPEAFVVLRLRAAETERSPAVMTDDLRPQVIADAKRLAAYELLKQDADQWTAKLASGGGGLDAIAVETSASSQAFTGAKRELVQQTGQLLPPLVPGIGRSAAFIDAVFETIEAGDGLPTSGSVLLDDQQKLALFNITDRTGMTASAFTAEASNPFQVLMLGMAVAGTPDFSNQAVTNPLSMQALKDRVDWVPDRDAEEAVDEQAAEDAAA